MGRVQQKVLFSHFSVVKCKIWKEIMNIWNYDICVWHPPTLIYVLISYVKEIRFWNQYPPTFYAMSSKSAVFFLTASLNVIIYISNVLIIHDSPKYLSIQRIILKKDTNFLNLKTQCVILWFYGFIMRLLFLIIRSCNSNLICKFMITHWWHCIIVK